MELETAENEYSLQELLEKADSYQEYWSDIYIRGQEDTDFALGEQWPAKIKASRVKDNRPCLVENRMLPFVNQVVNQIRQSRPSIVPKPVDDKADVQVAEVLRGVIRNIEVTSDADSVYDTAARNSVMAGVGWIRIITDYCDDKSFDQEVRLERIIDFQSVLLDPNHKRQDGSDAEDCFVFTDMDEDKFEKLYPKASKTGFSRTGWYDDGTIRVAEYFYKYYETKTVCEYEVQSLIGVTRGTALKDELPVGAKVLRERETQVCKIKYKKITELDELETGEFAGSYIPLVPVYGFEAVTDGKRTFYSLIHQAKDPQQMLNYWKSASTEIVALQPKMPFIGAKGQFASYAKQWAQANQINFPFLEYDPVNDDIGNPMPPPMRQAPPTSSGTMMQEAMGCADAIKATLGMYDASLGNQTQDISGKAIISRQMQGDNATFHFVDNLSVAIRHVGRILVGLIPIIYTGQRIVRILGEDGQESLVPLNRPVVKEGKGFRPATQQDDVTQIIKFDAGKYDVVVEVGPAYATRQQELANAIVEIARVKPEIMDVAGDLFIKALNVPNGEEIAKRIRATMDPALLGDDVEAQRLQMLTKALSDLQNKLQLTEEALLAKKSNEDFKNSLEAKKVENDTKKLMIEAAKAEAEIEKIKAEIHGTQGEAMGLLSKAIMELKAQTDDVSSALHVLLSNGEEEATDAPEASAPIESTDLGQPSGSGG